jgi:hypothetical protein
MIDKKLVAPCGMNCAICARYLALKNKMQEKGIQIPYCSGCRNKINKCSFQKKCEFLRKDKIEYCFECRDFPCERLERLDKRYQTHYKMSEINNLKFIKKYGIKEFLKNEEKRWKCHICRGLISCHNGLCFNCDRDKLKKKKRMYRWDGVG